MPTIERWCMLTKKTEYTITIVVLSQQSLCVGVSTCRRHNFFGFSVTIFCGRCITIRNSNLMAFRPPSYVAGALSLTTSDLTDSLKYQEQCPTLTSGGPIFWPITTHLCWQSGTTTNELSTCRYF